ncbi:hypothetical protein [Chitinophaga sp. sic0106]|uniref:hypothetical protein n=1 Tax=Chitinophaga sp. sic0106 TaxID=2854785 RepID=UPI001C445BC4|nr:hypothetical protein [Chitinophaga sp. sic0106]MBV7532758.1 hypothetical protein [Chitinophaga sp. sic0106]
MKRFKIFAVMIVLAVVAGTGVAKSGGGGDVYIGWYKPDPSMFDCSSNFYDNWYPCDRYSYGPICTIWGQIAYDDVIWCNLDAYDYAAKRLY